VVQCIVIGPVCGFVTVGGRCPNLTTASGQVGCANHTHAVFASLSTFFILTLLTFWFLSETFIIRRSCFNFFF